MKFEIAEAVFGKLAINPTGLTLSKMSALSKQAARSGDITQLGLNRTATPAHLEILPAKAHCMYIRPANFALDGFVAARVTATLARPMDVDEDKMHLLQKALIPRLDMSDAETAEVMRTARSEALALREVRKETIASLIDGDHSNYKWVRDTVFGSDMTDDNRPLGEGEKDELCSLSYGNLYRLWSDAKKAGADSRTLMAIHVELGLAAYTLNEKHAVAYEPFVTAIVEARIKQNLGNLDDSFRWLEVDRTRGTGFDLQVEVVMADDVSDKFKEALTDEVELGDGSAAGGSDAPELEDVDEDVEAAKIADQEKKEPARKGDFSFSATTVGAMAKGASTRLFGSKATPKLGSGVTVGRDSKTVSGGPGGGGGGRPSVPVDHNFDEDVSVAKQDVDWIAEVLGDSYPNSFDCNALDAVGTWRRVRGLNMDVKRLMARCAIGGTQCVNIDLGKSDPNLVAEFCTTRSYVIVKDLCNGSSRMAHEDDVRRGYITDAGEKVLRDLEIVGVFGPSAVMATTHSFLKSGHNITAAGLSNTFMSMYSAVLGDHEPHREFMRDDIGECLGSAIYPAAHDADKRLCVGMFMRMYTCGELSFSFGRRLSPLGPGTITPFLLANIMKQLAEAGFFEMLNRQGDYENFSNAYTMYKANCHLELPYSAYMYGESRAENVGFKNLMTSFAAYARTLGDFMPDSTFNLSVSLKRDAEAAAVNTLTAGIEVNAFVKAYKRYVETLVVGQLEARSTKDRVVARRIASAP